MSAGIETSQLQPLNTNPTERRAAAITCAAHIIQTGGSPHQLLELLRAIGLTHDPLARDRHPNPGVSTTHLRGPA